MRRDFFADCREAPTPRRHRRRAPRACRRDQAARIVWSAWSPEGTTRRRTGASAAATASRRRYAVSRPAVERASADLAARLKPLFDHAGRAGVDEGEPNADAVRRAPDDPTVRGDELRFIRIKRKGDVHGRADIEPQGGFDETSREAEIPDRPVDAGRSGSNRRGPGKRQADVWSLLG